MPYTCCEYNTCGRSISGWFGTVDTGGAAPHRITAFEFPAGAPVHGETTGRDDAAERAAQWRTVQVRRPPTVKKTAARISLTTPTFAAMTFPIAFDETP